MLYVFVPCRVPNMAIVSWIAPSAFSNLRGIAMIGNNFFKTRSHELSNVVAHLFLNVFCALVFVDNACVSFCRYD